VVSILSVMERNPALALFDHSLDCRLQNFCARHPAAGLRHEFFL
jgi:hypothetical protein